MTCIKVLIRSHHHHHHCHHCQYQHPSHTNSMYLIFLHIQKLFQQDNPRKENFTMVPLSYTICKIKSFQIWKLTKNTADYFEIKIQNNESIINSTNLALWKYLLKFMELVNKKIYVLRSCTQHTGHTAHGVLQCCRLQKPWMLLTEDSWLMLKCSSSMYTIPLLCQLLSVKSQNNAKIDTNPPRARLVKSNITNQIQQSTYKYPHP